MSVRAAKSGLGREAQAKLNSKYDAELAQDCLEWMNDIINSSLEGDDEPIEFDTDGSQDNFAKVLHDGVVLARMVNALMPGTISAAKLKKPPKLAFKQMELIELFIQHTKKFGVPDHELFQTVDLYERQNLHQVVICIWSLGRKAKAKGMNGFGPAESMPNPREFTEEQMKAGKNVISLQMGTNQGASQAGMTFGKQRMIID